MSKPLFTINGLKEKYRHCDIEILTCKFMNGKHKGHTAHIYKVYSPFVELKKFVQCSCGSFYNNGILSDDQINDPLLDIDSMPMNYEPDNNIDFD